MWNTTDYVFLFASSEWSELCWAWTKKEKAPFSQPLGKDMGKLVIRENILDKYDPSHHVRNDTQYKYDESLHDTAIRMPEMLSQKICIGAKSDAKFLEKIQNNWMLLWRLESGILFHHLIEKQVWFLNWKRLGLRRIRAASTMSVFVNTSPTSIRECC